MPLPNYGYYNKEKKEHQELKFKMAPEIVDDPDYVPDKFSGRLNEIFHKSLCWIVTIGRLFYLKKK